MLQELQANKPLQYRFSSLERLQMYRELKDYFTTEKLHWCAEMYLDLATHITIDWVRDQYVIADCMGDAIGCSTDLQYIVKLWKDLMSLPPYERRYLPAPYRKPF